MKKMDFLNKLLKEDLAPFKTKIKAGQPTYQLYKLDSADSDILMTVKLNASQELENYKMEGQELPTFDFTDLNGKRYNNASIKGKTFVLKTWFIKCIACVKEFPELNELVEHYKSNSDVVFLSLATDSKDDLVAFLKTKPFRYPTVPAVEDFIAEDLRLSMFPTHILVNKQGKIVKVVNNIQELIPFLKKEVG
jgi:thiol-disulfide isomerase/thioredoxin